MKLILRSIVLCGNILSTAKNKYPRGSYISQGGGLYERANLDLKNDNKKPILCLFVAILFTFNV